MELDPIRRVARLLPQRAHDAPQPRVRVGSEEGRGEREWHVERTAEEGLALDGEGVEEVDLARRRAQQTKHRRGTQPAVHTPRVPRTGWTAAKAAEPRNGGGPSKNGWYKVYTSTHTQVHTYFLGHTKLS